VSQGQRQGVSFMVSLNTAAVKGFRGFLRDKAAMLRETTKETSCIISSLLDRRPPVFFLHFWIEDPLYFFFTFGWKTPCTIPSLLSRRPPVLFLHFWIEDPLYYSFTFG
jgi:hypothetical protein